MPRNRNVQPTSRLEGLREAGGEIAVQSRPSAANPRSVQNVERHPPNLFTVLIRYQYRIMPAVEFGMLLQEPSCELLGHFHRLMVVR